MRSQDYDKKYDIITVGAGPAGLMAAITAARMGRSVLVIEQKDKPAKKIYATGNGRCNFTNLHFDENVFRGEHPEFAYEAYKRFDNNNLIAFMNELGVLSKDISGYVYPYNEQARTVAEALLYECRRLGIVVLCNEKVVDITRGCRVITDSKCYSCDSVIIAVGGKASPTHGSDGNLNKVIRKMGHDIVLQRSALVPLLFEDKKLSGLAGVRIKCGVKLYADDILTAHEHGEVIINKDNISGIPVMQLSRYAVRAMADSAKVRLELDLFEDMSADELCKLIRQRSDADMTIYEAVSLMVNEKLADYCIRAALADPEKKLAYCDDDEIDRVAGGLKSITVNIIGDSGFNRAQVTAGGVDVTQVTSDMESEIVKGIFFAGEILDIDGTCGGYNLQWAFTSGYIAGRAAAAS